VPGRRGSSSRHVPECLCLVDREGPVPLHAGGSGDVRRPEQLPELPRAFADRRRHLNTLIAPGSDLSVEAAAFINDRGEIYGTGTLPNSDQHVILLIPNYR
jgi:hypothetical protein